MYFLLASASCHSYRIISKPWSDSGTVKCAKDWLRTRVDKSGVVGVRNHMFPLFLCQLHDWRIRALRLQYHKAVVGPSQSKVALSCCSDAPEVFSHAETVPINTLWSSQRPVHPKCTGLSRTDSMSADQADMLWKLNWKSLEVRRISSKTLASKASKLVCSAARTCSRIALFSRSFPLQADWDASSLFCSATASCTHEFQDCMSTDVFASCPRHI